LLDGGVIAFSAQTAATHFTKEWLLSVGVALGGLVAFAVVVTVIGRRYVRRLVDKASAGKDDTDRERVQRLRRTATVAHLVLSTVQIAVWTIAILVVLASIGVNLGPLLAGAGIAGVALGFGAQSIVRDTLAGFFILAENQFDVGDTVDLQTTGGQVNGTVEALTLRITSIRAYNGTLSIVPNGNIMVTSNKTRGWGRAIVDVRLAYDQEVEQVRGILLELFDEIAGEPPFDVALREHPQVVGIVQLAGDAQILRVTAETVPSKRWEVERQLRERITTRLADRGVIVPQASVISQAKP
jgi:small conductance mechanosensitive channel